MNRDKFWCSGCGQMIEGEPVPIPVTRYSLMGEEMRSTKYSHDNPKCIENAMDVAKNVDKRIKIDD